MGTSSPTERGTAAPTFGPCLLWPSGRPSQLLLSSCFDFPLRVLILTCTHDVCIAPYTEYNSSLRCSGTARVNEGPATHMCMHVIPVPTFTPQPQSTTAFWPAWVAGCIPRCFSRSKLVTHPDTNRARRRVTSLIRPSSLLLCHAAVKLISKAVWYSTC